MRKIGYTLLALVMSVMTLVAKKDKVPAAAVTEKMMDAAEKFAKVWLREFPEKAKGLSRSKARDGLVASLKKQKVLTVSGQEQITLKKRKEVVSDIQLNNLVKNLKDDESAETKFLLKLATEKPPKREMKLLLFRLLGSKENERKKLVQDEAKKVIEEKKQVLNDIFKHYEARKAELKRMPADLEELALPEELAAINGKGWVYFGTRLALGNSAGRMLLFESEASADGKTLVLNDKGKIVSQKHEEMMKHWNKVKDKPAPKKGGAKPAKKSAKEPSSKPVAKGYDKQVQEKIIKVFKLVIAKTNETKSWPKSLAEAGVNGDLLTVKSKDGTEKKEWLYLPGKVEAQVKKGVTAIILSPYKTDKGHYVGLSNGQVMNLTEEQFKKIEAGYKKATGAQ